MANHYPVVRKFPLSEASPSLGTGNRIIDVGRSLSQINRRLYRYGRYYEVKIDLEPDSNTKFEVYALRDDWAVQKAFVMAYDHYRKATEDERAAMSDSQIARWEDFRISHPEASATVYAGPLLGGPGATVAELVNQGEHSDFQIYDAVGVAKTFTWGPTTAAAYSVLEEYDKAGNTQASPSGFVAGFEVPYENLEDDIDGLQANNLEAFGDQPPYTRDGVNAGDPLVKIATLVSNSPNAQKLSTGFFTAPCGLVILKRTTSENIQGEYSITCKAGNYKGVHAPSMLE